MLLAHVVWLDSQHSFFFLGISLLPPPLQNPEHVVYSHCADKMQDLGKQQISSCFVTFQLNLFLRCTLPLLLLQNPLCLKTILCVVMNSYLRQSCVKENSACQIKISMFKKFKNLNPALRWFSRIKNNWYNWKSKFHFN